MDVFHLSSHRLRALCGLSLVLLLASSAYSALPSHYRAHGDGPLTKDDFKASIPVDAPRDKSALAATELQYEYKFRHRTHKGKVTAHMTEVTVRAYLRTDKSWLRLPEDAALLDHEQGHFDNAQIYALQAEREFKRRIDAKKLATEASSVGEAQAILVEEIVQVMKTYEKSMQDADARYDEESLNGTLGPRQHEWRRVQRETLGRLTDERK